MDGNEFIKRHGSVLAAWMKVALLDDYGVDSIEELKVEDPGLADVFVKLCDVCGIDPDSA